MRPQRLVLDANQFVSAILKPDSNSGRILEMVRQRQAVLLLSKPIVPEIGRVLAYPKLVRLHGMDGHTQNRFLRAMVTVGCLVHPNYNKCCTE